MAQKLIVFHVGGAFHPTEEQAVAVADWLGADYACHSYDGLAAFEALDDADLLVLMGMHWAAGMTDDLGFGPHYQPMRAAHKTAFERYVASGRPLLVHHAAIFSYEDWPRFGELIGFQWQFDATRYAPVTEYQVTVEPTGHPIVAGVDDYMIVDELYVDVQITSGLNPQIHAAVYIQNEIPTEGNGHSRAKDVPMVFTAEGGRISGAGKVVYLANGHDMQTFECAALQQIWLNAVDWLVRA